jgi:hypothetical protein
MFKPLDNLFVECIAAAQSFLNPKLGAIDDIFNSLLP